ncbi:exodeoxyribonuclease V subunit alpha [Desulfomarina sp.]
MKVDRKQSFLELHLARFLAGRSQLTGEKKARFHDLVLGLAEVMGAGHTCLEVSKAEETFLRGVCLVGDQSDRGLPLILFRGRLYLQKYFLYESRLAEGLQMMARRDHAVGTEAERLLDLYFGLVSDETDWQREAVKLAIKKGLTIISGGPGTGKTTTIVKLLAVLLQLTDQDMVIGLCAPTGKAAMRLQQAVRTGGAALGLPADITDRISGEAMTIHRLLGAKKYSSGFRHDRNNPLAHDLLVVDEASMVDLALMSKLVDALKPASRLVLLGDKDQLVSVESGAVLADCIRSLPENTVELKKTWRFDQGIKEFAQAINEGDSASARAVLEDKRIDNVTLLQGDISGFVGRKYREYMSCIAEAGNGTVQFDTVFRAFSRFQVLCAVHYGKKGVEGINRQVEISLVSSNPAGIPYRVLPGQWYPGRPVMVTRNDYSLGIYNGDIGICLADPDSGDLKIWFEDSGGSYVGCFPSRLPPHETAFAITIHKSQGSEFEEVLLVLPETENRVLCRELLYTGVTRAGKHVTIAGERKVFEFGLSRPVRRFSGLREQLGG